MSKPSARHRTATPNTITQRVLIAVAAFATGAGTTWLIMHEKGPSPSQPPTYVTQRPGVAGEDSAPLTPDVSHLPPSQAAVTLGNWNYDHKNWTKAIDGYQRAISLGVDNSNVRTDLGNAYRFSGEPGKALDQYKIAQDQNPQHENSLFNTATLYAQMLNEPANAVRTFREYLRRFPNGEQASAAMQFLEEANSRILSGGQPGGPVQKPASELP